MGMIVDVLRRGCLQVRGSLLERDSGRGVPAEEARSGTITPRYGAGGDGCPEGPKPLWFTGLSQETGVQRGQSPFGLLACDSSQ